MGREKQGYKRGEGREGRREAAKKLFEGFVKSEEKGEHRLLRLGFMLPGLGALLSLRIHRLPPIETPLLACT